MVIVNHVIILSVYYFLTVMVQQLLNVTSLKHCDYYNGLQSK